MDATGGEAAEDARRVLAARAGDRAAFETNLTIDRWDYGVLGSRWNGGKVAINDTVYIHLALGG
jgi:hypothetical protein